jgi:hypothetical protein
MSIDVTIVSVGDNIVLADGRAAIVEGIRISAVFGNALLINGEWLDASAIPAQVQ